ncbi:diguanylate cyclase [Bacillus solitudinis]|uniref:diguanylate cyclase n=1 Tax=Bacillus solitudinis TaxID=2014074 RepID=UPI000C23CB51|nr:diguanylate cyclase [Bacillus solitudinis]
MNNLRTKLPLFIVLLVIFSILISGFITYSFSSELLLRKSKDEIKANAFRTSEAIHALVTSEIRKTEILASQQLFKNTLEAKSSNRDYFIHFGMATQALRDAYKGSSNHEKFWLGDMDGVVIASSEEKLETGSINVADRPYYIAALKGQPAVSGTINSRANGETIIVTVAPIKDNKGQVYGVIGNSIYTAFFSDPLKGIKVNDRGKLYIIDSNGMILAHSTDDSLIKTKVDNPQILSLLNEKPGDDLLKGTVYIEDHGVTKYVGFSKIPLADWIVIVEDDIEDIKSPLKELSMKFLIVLLLALAISLILVFFFLSQWVTKPLHIIMETVTDVSSGDLDAQVRLQSKDEFGVLAGTFNQMLVRIKDLMQAQEKANKLVVENVSERERSRMSEMLRSAMHTLSSSLDVNEVQQVALKELHAFVHYNRASIWSYDNHTLLMNALSEDSDHQLPQLNTNQIREYYEQISKDEQPIFSKYKNKNSYILVIPYHLHGKLIGLNVIEREQLNFERSEVELVLSYSSQVVVAISNANLYYQMEKMAVTDDLTGLYNRRYFYRLAQEEFGKTKTNNVPLSVVLFDIDHFKQINDRYGHFVGDKVLRQLASVILESIPKKNVLARYGGEEFVLLLPNLEGEDARTIAECMRKNVANHSFETERGTIKVSISIGISQFASEDNSIEALLHRADEALYLAKANGRNRIIFQ